MGNITSNKRLNRIEQLIIEQRPSCWSCKTTGLPLKSKCCGNCGSKLIRECVHCNEHITGIGDYCYRCGEIK